MNANGILAAAAGVLICVAFVAIAFVVLWILFCLTLQRVQTEVRPRNRLIAPGLVWLHLLHIGSVIPIAGYLVSIAAYVWDLIMVLKLAGSLDREFRDRGMREPGGGYGKVVGIVWCCSGLAMTLVNIAFAVVGQLMGNPGGKEPLFIAVGIGIIVLWLVDVICWIYYWVMMAGYGRRLREGGRRYRTGGIEDDYDDEMRGPLRDRDRDDNCELEEDDSPRRRRRRDEEDDYDDRRRRRDEDDDRPRRRDDY